MAFVSVEVGRAVPRARVRGAVIMVVVVKCMVGRWVVRVGWRGDCYVGAGGVFEVMVLVFELEGRMWGFWRAL